MGLRQGMTPSQIQQLHNAMLDCCAAAEKVASAKQMVINAEQYFAVVQGRFDKLLREVGAEGPQTPLPEPCDPS